MTAPLAREPAVVNAMTIDVEDYFQVSAFDQVVSRDQWDSLESRVCRNTERLLGIFDDAEVKATFFVLGWVAARFPELVRHIASAGHEIASHGYAHRLIYEQTPAEFREDVKRAKGLLEQLAGTNVAGYRAPSYSVTGRTPWAIDVLIEEGHAYDASVYPIHHDRYGMPNAPRHPYVVSGRGGTILEAPGSTVRVGSMNFPVGGGGYFRLLPYGWTRMGIARINRTEGRPAIFYLHPWEIDPDQPKFDPGLIGRFRHYRNLAKTEGRLRALLSDFRFAPLNSVLRGSVARAEVPSAAAPLPHLR
jgi:polysaccharide deacetylase family protein (PEP-CTERM system associated)